MNERPTPRETVDLLAEAIAGRYAYSSEEDLQGAIAEKISTKIAAVEREVRIADGERVDLMVGGFVVEVKVAGSPIAVLRQLLRYAHNPRWMGWCWRRRS